MISPNINNELEAVKTIVEGYKQTLLKSDNSIQKVAHMALCDKVLFTIEKEYERDYDFWIRQCQCQYCKKVLTDPMELKHHSEDHNYFPNQLCQECLDKVETNEIKITVNCLCESWLDPDRDNSCERCHQQFKHTELHKTVYHQWETYLCGPCLAAHPDESREWNKPQAEQVQQQK